MEIKPLGKRVLIKPKPSEEKTKGGIYIPDSAKEKTKEGTVKAIGKDVGLVGVGDSVMYESFAGTELKIGGEDYLIMEEKDILAKYN